jgi:hypothetical protein
VLRESDKVRVVKGQAVLYEYGSGFYVGKVVCITDDFYLLKGSWIGLVRVGFDNRYGLLNQKVHPLFKNGEPVMKRWWNICGY